VRPTIVYTSLSLKTTGFDTGAMEGKVSSTLPGLLAKSEIKLIKTEITGEKHSRFIPPVSSASRVLSAMRLKGPRKCGHSSLRFEEEKTARRFWVDKRNPM
jgi:hypothetical protein